MNDMGLVLQGGGALGAYGGTSRLEGFIHMLKELDKELPVDGPVRKHRAFYWLQRLRALNNYRSSRRSLRP